MVIDELLEHLKKLNIILTGRDLAAIWSMSEENVSRMKNGNKPIKAKYLEILEKKFDISLIKIPTLAEALMEGTPYQPAFAAKIPLPDDVIEIPYWQGLPDELKHPEYTFVLAQRASIEQGWNLKPENLCIIVMNGDTMENYWYKIRNNDVLIVDTSEIGVNANGSGVYFATSRNNSMFWVREMQALYNGDIEFRSYSPSGVKTKVLTQQELANSDFKIIGKVIKNVSFRL